jgi:hypothetical protein
MSNKPTIHCFPVDHEGAFVKRLMENRESSVGADDFPAGRGRTWESLHRRER